MIHLIPPKVQELGAVATLLLLLLGCGSMGPQGKGTGDGIPVTSGIEGPSSAAFPGQTVVVQLWYPAGPVDAEGAAIGSELVAMLRSGESLLSDRILELGAVSETWVEPTATVLSITTPSDLLKQVLALLAVTELPNHRPRYPANTNSGSGHRFNRLLNHAYDGGRLGFGFSTAGLDKGAVERLAGKINTSQASVVVVGPTESLNDVVADVRDAIGTGRSTQIVRVNAQGRDLPLEVKVEKTGGSQLWLMAAIPVRIRDGADAAYADVATMMLRRRIQTALLRRRLGEVNMSFVYSPDADSRIVFEIRGSQGRESQIWEVLFQELLAVSRSEVEYRDVSSALEEVRRSVTLQDGSVQGRARRLGALAHRFGVKNGHSAYQSALLQTNAQILTKAVSECVRAEKLRAVVMLPAEHVADADLYAETLTANIQRIMATPEDTGVDTARVFDDGSKVIVVRRPDSGTVAVSARLEGGLRQVPAHLVGAATMSAFLIQEFVAGSVVKAHGDGLYFHWVGPAKDAPAMLLSLGEAIRTPRWTSQALEAARRRTLTHLERDAAKPLPAAMAVGAGIEVVNAEQRRMSINGLTSASLGAWFRAHVTDAPMSLAFVGDLSEGTLLRTARQNLSRPESRAPIRRVSEKSQGSRTIGQLRQLNEQGDGLVTLGHLTSDDRERMRVLAALLEERLGQPNHNTVSLIHRHGMDYLHATGTNASARVGVLLQTLLVSEIPQDEHYRARRKAVSRQTIALSGHGDLSAWLIRQLSVGSGWVGQRAVSSWRAMAEGITRDEVVRVLRKVFTGKTLPTKVGTAPSSSPGEEL